MEAWRREADIGMRDLARHRPRSALGHLAAAVRGCPERRTGELARILFYLGVTMRRLGLTHPALRSWIAGQRLVKHGFAGRMLARFANEYGMERQPSAADDDWQAFLSVQLGRYLAARPSGRFQSDAERRMVTDLVRAHWADLERDHDLTRMTAAQKCALFGRARVAFPAVVMAHEAAPIPVDFARGRKLGPDDRCLCGSGRAYRQCCGRIPGLEERRIGT